MRIPQNQQSCLPHRRRAGRHGDLNGAREPQAKEIDRCLVSTAECHPIRHHAGPACLSARSANRTFGSPDSANSTHMPMRWHEMVHEQGGTGTGAVIAPVASFGRNEVLVKIRTTSDPGTASAESRRSSASGPDTARGIMVQPVGPAGSTGTVGCAGCRALRQTRHRDCSARDHLTGKWRTETGQASEGPGEEPGTGPEIRQQCCPEPHMAAWQSVCETVRKQSSVANGSAIIRKADTGPDVLGGVPGQQKHRNRE